MLAKDIKPRNLIVGQVFDDFSLATEDIDFNQEDLCAYITEDSNNYYWLNIESIWGPMGFEWDVVNDYGHFNQSTKNFNVLPKVPDGERIKHLNILIPSISSLNTNKDNFFRILKSNYQSLESLESLILNLAYDGVSNNFPKYIDADFTDSLCEQYDKVRITKDTVKLSEFHLKLKYNGYIYPFCGELYVDDNDCTVYFNKNNIDKLFIGTKDKSNPIEIYGAAITVNWDYNDTLDIDRIFKNFYFKIERNTKDTTIKLINVSNNNFIIKHINNATDDDSFNVYTYKCSTKINTNILNIYIKEGIIPGVGCFLDLDKYKNYDLVLSESYNLNITYASEITEIFGYKCNCEITSWDIDDSIIKKMKGTYHTKKHNNRKANKFLYNVLINTNEKYNNSISFDGYYTQSNVFYGENVNKLDLRNNNNNGNLFYDWYVPLTDSILYVEIYDNKTSSKILNFNYQYNIFNYSSLYTNSYSLLLNDNLDVNVAKSEFDFTFEYRIYYYYKDFNKYKITIHHRKNSRVVLSNTNFRVYYIRGKKELINRIDNLEFFLIDTVFDEDFNFEDTDISYVTYINKNILDDYGNNITIIHPLYIININYKLELELKYSNYAGIKNSNVFITTRESDIDELTNLINSLYNSDDGSITLSTVNYNKLSQEQKEAVIAKGFELIEQQS